MTPRLCVVGGGPAGLRAAEVAAAQGIKVDIFDAMPSVGRKFLVAGRGGLNISNTEPRERFIERYSGPDHNVWERLLTAFGPEDLRAWVEQFGISTFVGSGHRIYPEGMKSAPLLRRWVAALRAAGVDFFPRHRLETLEKRERWELRFATPDGLRTCETQAVVLALGGASWPQTGSDGKWPGLFERLGISTTPFQPSNCGWEVAWPAEFLDAAEGLPLKNITAFAGPQEARGELLITRDGIEGGPVYALTRHLRSMEKPILHLDLKPAFDRSRLLAKWRAGPRLHLHEACERWRIDGVARKLLETHPQRAGWTSREAIADAVKFLPLPLERPRPIAEAISSAGGVSWDELDENLMVRRAQGIFVAGEMIDWEAPTGGFLMQGCFSTGSVAGLSAARFLRC